MTNESPQESTKIRLSPAPLDIDDDVGFTEKNDIFEYKEFGESLARAFTNTVGLKVALLDDQWGSGKTIFAKQWAGLMRQNGTEVIYIDAFANDFHEDPFMMISTYIAKYLFSADNKRKEFIKDISGLAFSMLNTAVNAQTGGLLNVEEIENAVAKKVNQVGKSNNELSKFRETLKKQADGQNIIIIIDELDRCRPDFALRLLERVKHIFDVDGVSFLLVANGQQLGKMVSHTYGIEADAARTYLDKFVHLKCRLPDTEGIEKSQRYINHLVNYAMPDDPAKGTGDDIEETFFRLTKMFNCSLRDIEKIFSCFLLVCASKRINENTRSCVLALAFLKVKHPDFLKSSPLSDKNWEKLRNILGDSNDPIDNGFREMQYIIHYIIAFLVSNEVMNKIIGNAPNDSKDRLKQLSTNGIPLYGVRPVPRHEARKLVLGWFDNMIGL